MILSCHLEWIKTMHSQMAWHGKKKKKMERWPEKKEWKAGKGRNGFWGRCASWRLTRTLRGRGYMDIYRIFWFGDTPYSEGFPWSGPPSRMFVLLHYLRWGLVRQEVISWKEWVSQCNWNRQLAWFDWEKEEIKHQALRTKGNKGEMYLYLFETSDVLEIIVLLAQILDSWWLQTLN